MDLNQKKILIEISGIRQTLLAIEKRMTNLERINDKNATGTNLFEDQRFKKVESDLEFLCGAVARLHRKDQIPVSHQLAESVTGIIGLKESITTRNLILKCAWIFLFCLGIGATIFFTYTTTKEYLDEPTLTKVKIQNNETYEYPPIVLCNNAWFDSEKAANLGLSIDALKYSLGYDQILELNKMELKNITDARSQFHNIFFEHRFSGLVDYYKAIAVDLESTAEQQTDQVFVTLTTSICPAFFLPPVSGRIGPLAYTLPITINFTDKTTGLVQASNFWMLFLSEGAESMYSWPLIVKSSTTTYLTLRVKKHVAFQTTDTTCLLGDQISQNYSSATCMTQCANLIIKKIIGCRILLLSDEFGQPTENCNHFDMNVLQIYYKNQMEIHKEVEDICFEKCPTTCVKLDYEVTIQGEHPFTDVVTTATDSNASLTKIEIVHGAILRGGIVTYQELTSYSYIELVNNIGGTLGLFIGGTLLTLAQLILFFVGHMCDNRKNVTIVRSLSKD